jgi:hypothetical protein
MNGPSTLAREPRRSFFAFLRLFLALIFALALALSPLPAFAQHGGGGGGGHAGGGGGGHAGGGGGHASGGGPAAGSRGGAPAGYGGGSGTSAARGTSTGSGTYVSGARASNSSARFFGGNNTWQAPPTAGSRNAGPSQHFVSSDEAAAAGARVMGAQTEPRGIRGPFSPSTAMRGTFVGARTSVLPPHIPPFPPRRFQPVFFIGGGCFNGFFPGFCGGFFGGAAFFGYGYGWGCDPYWGCPAGYYNGYFNGGSYGSEIYNDSSDSGAISNEFNPSRWASPPEAGMSGDRNSDGSYAANAPEMVLYLKDGTVYALADYWAADGKLHYVTNYGGENAIDLDTIDMQKTVDVNAKRGINVTLRPAPTQQDQSQPPSAPNSSAPPQQ